jgi:GTP-binding protein HflX
MQESDPKPTRAVVAAVQLASVSDAEFEASLTELRQLAKTLGFEVVGRFTQKRAGFESGAYFGTGKREELRLLREQEAADVVLIDHEISPSQQFNLAKEVGCEVMDRTMVILEIFHRHAASRYARAQVEIARLSYLAPRLREEAKLAGPKDRAAHCRERVRGVGLRPWAISWKSSRPRGA